MQTGSENHPVIINIILCNYFLILCMTFVILHNKSKTNWSPPRLLYILPWADLRSPLSPTDRETEKAWSAVRRTNFRLPGFMMPCWSVHGSTQMLHCGATIIQSQSGNSWCAGVAPRIQMTSWNLIERGAFGNPEDSWLNRARSPHPRTPGQTRAKWVVRGGNTHKDHCSVFPRSSANDIGHRDVLSSGWGPCVSLKPSARSWRNTAPRDHQRQETKMKHTASGSCFQIKTIFPKLV